MLALLRMVPRDSPSNFGSITAQGVLHGGFVEIECGRFMTVVSALEHGKNGFGGAREIAKVEVKAGSDALGNGFTRFSIGFWF